MPGNGYTGTICWIPADTNFTAGTSYTATVTLTADNIHQFTQGAAVNVQGAQIDVQSTVISTEPSGNTLTFDAVFPPTEQSQPASGEPQDASKENAETSPLSIDGAVGAVSGGSPSSGGSVITTSSVASSTDSDTNENAPLTTAFTVTSGKADTLSVSIDELDVMSIQAGQDVTIVLDALPDETFHGTVTKISASGTIQSGVTTYPVTITLSDIEGTDILSGMNATATISVATRENVLLIPLDSLQESGNETFVLIAGNSGGESSMGERRTVETGLSDGINVEILSGLTEGEQIMYEESASIDSSEQSGFSRGNMGSMGTMGGGMPPEANMQGGAPMGN